MSAVVLTDADFARLRALLAGAAGLVFDDSRRDSLRYSLSERLRATGLPDVAAYLDAVGDPASPERQRLLDEVTIQETHFFRNPPQMRALRAHVLPQLLREAETRGRRLRIWSAGCSTGEEPYTIAMMLRELLPTTAGWDVKVVATDISEWALAAAAQATYGTRAVQLATPAEVGRFFTPVGDGRHRVRDEVRELVEFRHHNLVHDPAVEAGLDLVLCRNVTIYFARETTRALVERLHTALRDGGYLFLGHSETLWQISEQFRLVTLGTGEDAAYVYRRQDGDGERRAVLPDRRTAVEPRDVERRSWARRAPVPPRVLAPPPVDLVADARAALDLGRYEDAAVLARRAAAAEPMRGPAHYVLGVALVDLGRDVEALPALRKAVYLLPESGLAHFQLAGVLARTGARDAATREYRAAALTLGRDPEAGSAPELGGRSVRELAALCAQLAAGDPVSGGPS